MKDFRQLFTIKDKASYVPLDKWFKQLSKNPSTVRKRMNKHITKAEIVKSIRKLRARKSLGIDGLGSAFYKKFADVLAPILGDALAGILQRKLLSPTMR